MITKLPSFDVAAIRRITDIPLGLVTVAAGKRLYKQEENSPGEMGEFAVHCRLCFGVHRNNDSRPSLGIQPDGQSAVCVVNDHKSANVVAYTRAILDHCSLTRATTFLENLVRDKNRLEEIWRAIYVEQDLPRLPGGPRAPIYKILRYAPHGVLDLRYKPSYWHGDKLAEEGAWTEFANKFLRLWGLTEDTLSGDADMFVIKEAAAAVEGPATAYSYSGGETLGIFHNGKTCVPSDVAVFPIWQSNAIYNLLYARFAPSLDGQPEKVVWSRPLRPDGQPITPALWNYSGLSLTEPGDRVFFADRLENALVLVENLNRARKAGWVKAGFAGKLWIPDKTLPDKRGRDVVVCVPRPEDISLAHNAKWASYFKSRDLYVFLAFDADTVNRDRDFEDLRAKLYETGCRISIMHQGPSGSIAKTLRMPPDGDSKLQEYTVTAESVSRA